MKGPPLGPGGEDITWPDQVAPRGQKASSTRNLKPQTSNLHLSEWPTWTRVVWGKEQRIRKISNKSRTWLGIREALRGATADLVGDLTQARRKVRRT